MTDAVLTHPAPWTLEDLLALPEDGQRYEIIDGSLLVNPPPSTGHQGVAGRLTALLRPALSADLVALEGVGVQLGGSVLIPDVLVMHADLVWPSRTHLLPADVLLAVEIVSPSSRTTDRITKLALYAQAGIPAYWRVEPTEPAVYVYSLVGTSYAEPLVASADEPLALDHPAPLTVCAADLVR